MTFAELVQEMASKCSVPKDVCRAYVAAVAGAILERAGRAESTTIKGLGTFHAVTWTGVRYSRGKVVNITRHPLRLRVAAEFKQAARHV